MIEVQSTSKVNAIPSPELKQAIERVLFATTNERARYLLNVIRFSSDGFCLKLEATDGRRASAATIDVELPAFEFLVSTADCKALKKLCRLKRDTINVSLDYPNRRHLTFQSNSGETVVIGNDPEAEGGSFAPIEHVLAMEPDGTIPVLDPEEFQRGVSLALAARRDGERTSKETPHLNVIHLTSTPRKTTVFGKRNGNRAITYLDSNESASPVSLKVNGAYLLELLKVLPKGEPFQLRQWGNGTKGVAFVSPTFTHYLCGIRVREAA